MAEVDQEVEKNAPVVVKGVQEVAKTVVLGAAIGKEDIRADLDCKVSEIYLHW